MELCLGTVQLGMEYGIASNGMPNKIEAIKILEGAVDKRILTFDTSSAYGESENLIGDFLENCRHRDIDVGNIKIISKYYNSGMDLIDTLYLSLEKLRLNKIDGYLLHSAKDMFNETIVNDIINSKESGMAENIGVSVYEPEDAIYAAKQNWINYIQIPYNLFDQRLNHTDFFQLCRKYKKKIFARSAFLQGLLLMPQDEIDQKFPEASRWTNLLHEIVEKYKSSNISTAIQYVKDNKDIDYLVFGAERLPQLEEIVRVFNDDSIPDDMICELKKSLNSVDRQVISPYLWNIKR